MNYNDNEFLKAAEIGYVEMVERYIEHYKQQGISVDHAKNNLNQTALHIACMSNRTFKVMSMLLNAGADVNHKDNHYITPLYEFISWYRVHILWFGYENGAAYNYLCKVFRLFLDHGANVNAKIRYGTTVLHYAVNNQLNDVVELLLDNGFDKNIKNANKETAESAARIRGFHDIAKFIRDHESTPSWLP